MAATGYTEQARLMKVHALSWLIELLDLNDNIYPAALKDSTWCPSSILESFTKTKFVEDTINMIPKPLYEFQMKYFYLGKRPAENTFESFKRAGEVLYLRYTQNTSIGAELHNRMNEVYLNLFGAERLNEALEKANVYFAHYKSLYELMKRDYPTVAALNVDTTLFIKAFKDLDPPKLKIKMNTLLDSNTAYFRTLTNMLSCNDCTFRNVILDMYSYRMKDETGIWNSTLGHFIFFEVDHQILISAFGLNPEFLKLFIEYLNECVAKFATRRILNMTSGPIPSNPLFYWELQTANIQMSDLQVLFKRIFAVVDPNYVQTNLESLTQHNTGFWRTLFGDPELD